VVGMRRRRPIRERVGKVVKKRVREGLLFPRLAERVRQRPILKSFFEEWKPESLDAQDFFEDFRKEALRAKDCVIIFSPFTYKIRVNNLIKTVFSDLNKRNIKVEVHTLDPEVRSIRKKRDHKENIKKLKDENVEVIPRKNMHEKAVFVDNRTSYLGSLNVLSGRERGGSDYMLKFESEELTKYFQLFIEVLEDNAEY